MFSGFEIAFSLHHILDCAWLLPEDGESFSLKFFTTMHGLQMTSKLFIPERVVEELTPVVQKVVVNTIGDLVQKPVMFWNSSNFALWIMLGRAHTTFSDWFCDAEADSEHPCQAHPRSIISENPLSLAFFPPIHQWCASINGNLF